MTRSTGKTPAFLVTVLCAVALITAATFWGPSIYQYAVWRFDRHMLELASDARYSGNTIQLEMDRRAVREAAEFVLNQMPQAKRFTSLEEMIEHSLAQVDPSLKGLYCEFGVFKGTSINFIASKTESPVHGFDSFEGLPEQWWRIPKKGFQLDGLPTVRENVVLHKGWFDETLPGFREEHPGPIAFLHLDADLYSSTKTVFDLLGGQIRAGTIIQFDEYFKYPQWRDHEYKAFQEFIAERNVRFEYLSYLDTGLPHPEPVAVRIVSIETD